MTRRRRVTPRPADAPLSDEAAPAPAPAAGRHERDAELVGPCLAGDREAWAELLTRHRPLVMTIARRHGLRGDAAEELFQATCLTMLQRLDLLRDHQSLAAWIATTATRKAWRTRSRDAGTSALAKDVEDAAPSPDRAFAEAAQQAAVRRAVLAMDDPCRSLLLGLFEEEAPYDEVARRLGLAIGSIGVYRRRCLDRLKRRLQEEGWTWTQKEGP